MVEPRVLKVLARLIPRGFLSDSRRLSMSSLVDLDSVGDVLIRATGVGVSIVEAVLMRATAGGLSIAGVVGEISTGLSIG